MATEDILYRVIVIGSSKVGKTSLIQRYKFNEFNYEVPQTQTEEKVTVMVKDKPVHLLICDLADRTDPLTRHYYEQTHAVIFVYDVTNPETLWNSQAWIKDLRIHLNEKILSQTLPVLFVGNKIDLLPEDMPSIDDEQSASSPKQDYVTLKHAKRILDRENFKLEPMQCSALKGKNVNKVFERIASELAGERQKWPIKCNIL